MEHHWNAKLYGYNGVQDKQGSHSGELQHLQAMTTSRKTDVSSYQAMNTCCHLPGAILKAMYGHSHLMHTTTPERGVTIMTILGMKPLRHGERRYQLSRETKPLIRSLGLEPIHFTVLGY